MAKDILLFFHPFIPDAGRAGPDKTAESVILVTWHASVKTS